MLLSLTKRYATGTHDASLRTHEIISNNIYAIWIAH